MGCPVTRGLDARGEVQWADGARAPTAGQSAEEEVDVLLDAEPKDNHQLDDGLDASLKSRIVAARVPVASDLLQARQDGSALRRSEISVVVRVIEKRCQSGVDVAPGALSAEAPHLREVEPLGLSQPSPEIAEAVVRPGDVRAGDVSVVWKQIEPHHILLGHRVHSIVRGEGRWQLK